MCYYKDNNYNIVSEDLYRMAIIVERTPKINYTIMIVNVILNWIGIINYIKAQVGKLFLVN